MKAVIPGRGWTRHLAGMAGLLLAGAQSPARAEGPSEPALPTVGRVVELPPFLVQENDKHSPWLFGRLPGFEILSRCPEGATERFVEQIYRANQLFDALVPPDLHPPMSAPTTYLIYGDDMKQAVPPEVLQAMDHVSITPNFMLTDADELEVVALVPRFGRHPDLALTSASVRFMLGRRVPAPPSWFIEGFLSLYREIVYRSDAFKVAPARWISDPITESIGQDAEFPRQLLPMPELFSTFQSTVTRNDPRFVEVWRSQAALFIRWAMERERSGGPAALWKFVAGASARPVTEGFFQECFGLDYADMLERLADYLTGAVNRPFEIAAGKLPAVPAFELRRATAAEVSRITGEWERLEVAYVKPRFPPLVGRYVDQARLTVRAAYDRGERDPGLLAVMGLDALEAGETRQARGWLESAERGGVSRPRVYYELAHLRYLDARLIPTGGGGRLSASQTESILEPLYRGLRLQPALMESYALACEVWLRSSEQATPAQLELLKEGVRSFPWNFALIDQVIVIEAGEGRRAEAAALVAHGLDLIPGGPWRDRFLQMQKALARGAGPAVAPK